MTINTIISRSITNKEESPRRVETFPATPLIIESDENTLGKFKEFRHKNRVEGYAFRNFKAALVKLGLRLRRGKLNSLKPAIMLVVLKQKKGDVTK